MSGWAIERAILRLSVARFWAKRFPRLQPWWDYELRRLKRLLATPESK